MRWCQLVETWFLGRHCLYLVTNSYKMQTLVEWMNEWKHCYFELNFAAFHFFWTRIFTFADQFSLKMFKPYMNNSVKTCRLGTVARGIMFSECSYVCVCVSPEQTLLARSLGYLLSEYEWWKTSKIRRDLGQLLTLSANVSWMDGDIHKRLMVLSTTLVFFNLFTAAEPYISATITHGTPCTDKRVQRCRQSGIFRVSGDWCPQRSQETENL